MKVTIELTEKEVMKLKDLIFGEEKPIRKDIINEERLIAEFDDKLELFRFIDDMMNIAKTYGFFTVEDFKCMIGRNDTKYTDHKYGWTYKSLVNVTYDISNGKYRIVMPKYYPWLSIGL